MPSRFGYPRSPVKKMNRNIDTLNLSKFCFASTKGLLTLSKPELIKVIQCLQGKVTNPDKCNDAGSQTWVDECKAGATQTDVGHVLVNPGIEVNVIPSVIINEGGICTSIKPYIKYPSNLFEHIDITKLNKELTYTHNLGNRSVAYYGQYPYAYGNTMHEPREVTSNSMLSEIILSVRANLPNVEFNSVMVSCYEDGSKYIPYHSDDECHIADGSTITTISFGETQSLFFRPTPSSTLRNPHTWTSTDLAHGEVLFMSKLSQKLFQHGIHRSGTGGLRISLTLRQIRPIQSPSHLNIPSLSHHPTQEAHEVSNNVQNTSIQSEQLHGMIPKPQQGQTETLYISSSMFAGLDPWKLTTENQTAHVFSFPGATASDIRYRLMEQQGFLNINQSEVGQIVLMAGTNNVDNVVGASKYTRAQLIPGHRIHHGQLEDTINQIDVLVEYLSTRFPTAKITLMKILPRVSQERNAAINEINYFISSLGERYSNVYPIPAGKMNTMFCKGTGSRIASLFSTKGDDNVHLSSIGLIRLAKYMKFLAHN